MSSTSEDIEDKLRLASPTIYEIISTEGEEELSDRLRLWDGQGLLLDYALVFPFFAKAISGITFPKEETIS